MVQQSYLRRFGVLAYLPALNFIWSSCEEVDQLDGPEACGDNLIYGTLRTHLQHHVHI
jgi:hypothetical protein